MCIVPVEQGGVRRLVDHGGEFLEGPEVALAPGAYRARVTLEQTGAAAWPGEVAGVIGFSPADRGWSRETRAVRPLDLGSGRTRTYDFTFTESDSARRRWVWRVPGAEDGLVAVSSEVRREVGFWRALFGRDTVRASARRFVASALFAFVALAAAWILGRRVSKSHATGGAVATAISAVLGFVLGGVALYAAGVAMAVTAGEGAMWQVFPGWETPLASWSAPAAAALSLATLFAAVLSLGANRVLPWVFPAAALGLAYSSGLTGPRGDFHVYYATGQALLAGVNPYALAFERVLSPPPFTLSCTLFALAPIPLAGYLWFGFKTACAAGCILWARRALTESDTTGLRAAWLRPEWIGVLVTGRWFFLDLEYGNTNVVVLAALLLAAAAWSNRRELAGATAVAAGAAVKITPLFAALGALAAGRLRSAITALLLSVAIFAIGTAVLENLAGGAGGGFPRLVYQSESDLSLGRADNQSIRALSDRFIGGSPVETATLHSVPTLDAGRDTARLAQWALSLPVLLLILWVARRAGRLDGAAGRAAFWSAVALGILLLSPASWSVHYVLWYVPAVALAARATRGSRLAIFWLLAMAAVATAPAVSRPVGDALTVYGALPILSIALLLDLAYTVRRSAPQSPSTVAP